jgi:Uncharacterized conserved protein
MTEHMEAFEIREIETVEQAHQAAELLDRIWPGPSSALPANVIRALAHSGNYVVGIFDGAEMVGAVVAFFGPPESRSMHSHVAGVLSEYQGRGVGRMLKQHQREWAFSRGIGHITWTFDPLIARNAHFNLTVLGARVTEYLVDQYGSMGDGVNRGDESDRLFVSWALAAPASAPREEDVVTSVAIPSDIAALRRDDPSEALEWRYRVRDAFLGLLEDGLVVVGFDNDRGYLFGRA